MSKGPHARNDRLLRERRHDVYEEREKRREPTVCTDCGAVFANGRWCWKEAPVNPKRACCPACRRCADGYPAAYIEIKGEFFEEHRTEMLNLIRNTEKQEKAGHPLERIMSIRDEKDCTLITTTGVHVARRIGEALSRSYKGDFSFHYGEGEKNLRVYWQR